MSSLYIIPLGGLKVGHHTYDYSIGNKFFEKFEESEIKAGNLSATIELERKSSHLEVVIKIKGKVKICCDRCLEEFFYPIDSENRLLVEFGKAWDLDNPDILIVPTDEKELDLSQYIYEFIHLTLPIKRIHSTNKKGESTCNPEMLEKLKEHLVDNEKKNDPRWEELKKLLNAN
jgi:uncharacterized protein